MLQCCCCCCLPAAHACLTLPTLCVCLARTTEVIFDGNLRDTAFTLLQDIVDSIPNLVDRVNVSAPLFFVLSAVCFCFHSGELRPIYSRIPLTPPAVMIPLSVSASEPFFACMRVRACVRACVCTASSDGGVADGARQPAKACSEHVAANTAALHVSAHSSHVRMRARLP